MSGASKIQWTEATWNPTVGCSRVSEGCRHCYAEVMAARIANAAQAKLRAGKALTATEQAYRRVVRWRQGGKVAADFLDEALPAWNGRVELVDDKLMDPLRWRKPRRVFVNSMSDLFHEGLSFEQLDQVFAVMLACEVLEARAEHTFQILTKRPEVAREYLSAPPVELLKRWAKAGDGLISLDDPDTFFSEVVYSHCGAAWDPDGTALGEFSPWSHPENLFPLRRVQLGTSVEDQPSADLRISEVLQCPAAVHFVSYEPALGPVDFSRQYWLTERPCPVCRAENTTNTPRGRMSHPINCGWRKDQGTARGGIDQVIFGGESGPGARPCDIEWARSTVRQCQEAGVPVFVKQLGSLPVEFNEVGTAKGGCHRPMDLRDRKGGDPSEWPEDLRIRQYPEARL